MEQSYLTLGDMLTFVGLIIAVWQLIKPRNRLVWRLSSAIIKIPAVTLLFIGYIVPLVSVFLPKMVEITVVFGATLTLGQYIQIAGFILITVGMLISLFIYSPYNKSHLIICIVGFKLATY